MLLLAILAGAAAAQAPETIKFRAAEALVVDKDGKPLFRTPRDFLLTVAGNPDGKVLAYDAARRMVRVSDNNPWWIPCSELQPQPFACSAPAKPKTRSIKLPKAAPVDDAAMGPDGRGVPSCPGDPRCPNAG